MPGTMEGFKAHPHGRKIYGRGRMDTGPGDGRVCRMDHPEDAGSRTVGKMEKDHMDGFFCGVFWTADIGTGRI